ncbi:hypothetical protein F2P58_00330 [Vibrio fortis]|uniref:Uncharacterized protein n=1 Tax=Vibrio fortis TaxID=212667 RepID=A0A5N3RAW6_9VIBR|nr:hypothetical protein [Vibrio fortis]KAB0291639.1 hypothetical protein F2P58_00330 [Vibrio fortis]
METKTTTNIPIATLYSPRGRQRLRIFEQKNLTMVAHAAQGDGFVIASHDNRNNSPLKDWGTKVKIVDFKSSDDKYSKSMWKVSHWLEFSTLEEMTRAFESRL